MPSSTYRIAGLCVRSAVSLPAPLIDAEADLVIDLAPAKSIEKAPPTGEIWVDAEFGPELRTVLARHEHGYTLRYLGRCEVAIDTAAQHFRVTPDRSLPEGFVDVLAAASILSIALNLRGKTALHASAVAFDGRAVAIAGLSGSGKSTLACSLCASGAGLLADDLIALDASAPALHVPFSSSHIRLRDRGIAERLGLPAEKLVPTADHRWAFRPPELELAGARLHAIVLPEIVSEATELGLLRLDAEAALAALTTDARRTVGVVHPAWMARDFLTFARLAREVPTFSWHLIRGRHNSALLRTHLTELLAVR